MTPYTEIALRLAAAVVAGGAIGLNRRLRHKPAGLRTHALVALGAATAVLVADDADASTDGLTRVVQGVITGIGFLGAGVIVHRGGASRGGVSGLTTAASIWVAAMLGLAAGTGRWALVALPAAATLLVLLVGGPIERTFHRRRRAAGDDPAGERARGAPRGVHDDDGDS